MKVYIRNVNNDSNMIEYIKTLKENGYNIEVERDTDRYEGQEWNKLDKAYIEINTLEELLKLTDIFKSDPIIIDNDNYITKGIRLTIYDDYIEG